MSLYVVDANVVAKWFVPEPSSVLCPPPTSVWPTPASAVRWLDTSRGSERRAGVAEGEGERRPVIPSVDQRFAGRLEQVVVA